ncbi:MAG: DUF3592 domain-containing protein [Oscillospiraceae bacterium]|nr:DUF3592 domain-containing protein [Oscillospiraceae bacterium]
MFIKIMCLALIVGFSAMAVVSAYKLTVYYRIKKRGKFAEGTIAGLKEKTNILVSMGASMNQESPKLVHPIVEYTDADGNTARAVYRGYEMKGKGTYTEGKQVQIKYDPLKPEDIIIIGDSNFHGNCWCCAVLGIIFAAICVIMYKIMLF